MKTIHKRFGKAGYVSYVMVISTGSMLMLATFFVFRTAMNQREVQSKVQMRVDYSEKEDAILRSIVAITPNRAMQAMMHENGGQPRDSLRWSDIFFDAVQLANARTSAGADLLQAIGGSNRLYRANVGDSTLTDISQIFSPVAMVNTNEESTFCSTGIDRSLGDGFPPPLQSTSTRWSGEDPAILDATFPIISTDKRYGTLASGRVGLSTTSYPDFNLIPYPQINFGYTRPGEPFVAKRNWWAFEMDLGAADRAATKLMAPRRTFVFSIYEIPSQLAISSSSFMSLGRHGSGDAWTNVTIEGNVFAGKAVVEGNVSIDSLSSRRSMEIATNARIGGETFFANPFTPGTREEYQITQGEFYPVSLASESGRVAFIPINRGALFLDRHAHEAETNTISPTTWNRYTSGALQCAMSLDITAVDPATKKPTEFRFRAKPDIDFRQPTQEGVLGNLPEPQSSWTYRAGENGSYDFGDQAVDVAYGANGRFYFQTGVRGVVEFNNSRFGDPIVGTYKLGYSRPSSPFSYEQITDLTSTRWCVELKPERIPAFLSMLGADDPSINHSIVVNVDYTTSGLNDPELYNPMANGAYRETLADGTPNYALILRECADLTAFTKGFSIVSNLRTHIDDNFNIEPTTPPAGYVPVGNYYPPLSLFVPEKRFGGTTTPFGVRIAGQVGSLGSDQDVNPSRVLDAKNASGQDFAGSRIEVNLKPIEHPAALPPVYMMNWLVTMEELRGEHAATTP